MSTLILAVFNDFETAERVRVSLVKDGFPTDRVELTAPCELGRAGCEPATTPHEKCVQYFRTLLRNKGEEHYPEMLALRIDNGAACVTVQPRGAIETARATEILQQAHPADVVAHDLAKHGWEHAASKHGGKYWIVHVWLEHTESDCIYCRLFPGSSH